MDRERLAELEKAAKLMKGTPNGSAKWKRGRTILMEAMPELLDTASRAIAALEVLDAAMAKDYGYNAPIAALMYHGAMIHASGELRESAAPKDGE